MGQVHPLRLAANAGTAMPPDMRVQLMSTADHEVAKEFEVLAIRGKNGNPAMFGPARIVVIMPAVRMFVVIRQKDADVV